MNHLSFLHFKLHLNEFPNGIDCRLKWKIENKRNSTAGAVKESGSKYAGTAW